SESVEKDLVKMKPSAKFIRLAHPWYDQFGLKLDKETAQKKLGLDPNKRTLLFFGLIRDYKGLDILLEAFELLNDQYQLVIAGEVYSNADKYKQQITKSKSKDSIFFFDRYIDDSEVSTFFSATDICVLPYRSATQSGITAIAFQFEVPCVVTNVGGLKSIVEEVGGGIAVNKVEAQSLKEGIENVFEGDKLQQMQVNLQKYKDENTWDTFAERIIEFSKTLD
ncbi:MAG: glycosyltransferase, partial [Crocinitomicaceae bacterium]|nr:glycosyltransferase [Crocinitomicaceae bacterium]